MGRFLTPLPLWSSNTVPEIVTNLKSAKSRPVMPALPVVSMTQAPPGPPPPATCVQPLCNTSATV